jgi:hypothetical protein
MRITQMASLSEAALRYARGAIHEDDVRDEVTAIAAVIACDRHGSSVTPFRVTLLDVLTAERVRQKMTTSGVLVLTAMAKEERDGE